MLRPIPEEDVAAYLVQLNQLLAEQADGPTGQDERHIKADTILCECLTRLGYDDIVELYRKVDKWFS